MFGRAVLVGFGEIWLCPSVHAGVAMLGAALMLSTRAAALALAGGLVATAWAFWAQRDARLLAAGWYGMNGVLAGLWSSWLVTDPRGAALTTIVGALAVAWLLDVVVFPLGDAPPGFPPLSLPFVVVALLGMPALPLARDAMERIAGPGPSASTAPVASAWLPVPTPLPLTAEIAAAWSAWQREDYARARAQFAALAARAPQLAEAHNGHGWSLFKLAAFDEADTAFRRALESDARYPYPLDGLGWIAFRRGRHAEAARLFRAASDAAPGWADPHDGLGWAAYMRGRYRQARAHFERAVALEARHASALSGLGWTALLEDRVNDARRFFEAASAADPRLFVAQEGLGWALARSGRARDAERVFATALARFPRERAAIFGLADARRRLILSGHRPAIEPSLEWSAIGQAFPRSTAAAVLLVAAALVLRMPWAGLVGILCAASGAALSAVLAGPSALAWLDLHVQTLAPLGLLVGRATAPSGRGLVTAVSVAAVGTAAWALLHLVNVTTPLLVFNAVGLAFLAVRRHADRDPTDAGLWLRPASGSRGARASRV